MSKGAVSPLDHALLVSRPVAPRRGQPLTSGLSSLFLALDPRFRPRSVALIFDRSEFMYARAIEVLLTSRKIEVTCWPISSASPEEATHEVSNLLDSWGKVLPLCVGSSHATLTAVTISVFTARRCPILQVVQSVLYRVGSTSQHIRLEPQFEIAEILTHLGARISGGWEGVWFEEHLRELSHFLIESAHGCVAPLEVIQRLARQTDSERLLSPRVKGTEIAIPLFQEVLDRFESAGCLELNQGRLKFINEKHRAYCSGGWLSLYVQAAFDQMQEDVFLHCTRQDITLELAYPTPLEVSIPLTVAVDGRLCFFFCVSSSHANLNVLFEASERLQDYFGATVLMLSIDEFYPEDQERARLLGIPVCVGDELKNMETWLMEIFLE